MTEDEVIAIVERKWKKLAVVALSQEVDPKTDIITGLLALRLLAAQIRVPFRGDPVVDKAVEAADQDGHEEGVRIAKSISTKQG